MVERKGKNIQLAGYPGSRLHRGHGSYLPTFPFTCSGVWSFTQGSPVHFLGKHSVQGWGSLPQALLFVINRNHFAFFTAQLSLFSHMLSQAITFSSETAPRTVGLQEAFPKGGRKDAACAARRVGTAGAPCPWRRLLKQSLAGAGAGLSQG